MPPPEHKQHPLVGLEREDLDLITQFVLTSGSLKDLAQHYGVSYPTIRTRIDQLIERLTAAVAGKPRDPMAELLARMVERGEVAPTSARNILKLHREAHASPERR